MTPLQLNETTAGYVTNNSNIPNFTTRVLSIFDALSHYSIVILWCIVKAITHTIKRCVCVRVCVHHTHEQSSIGASVDGEFLRRGVALLYQIFCCTLEISEAILLVPQHTS